MQSLRDSLFTRSTTIFGVCEALGEDFGVSPTWFRVAFASGVVFNLEYAVAAYALAGVLVLISRFAFPSRRKAAAETAQPVAAQDRSETADAAPAHSQGKVLEAA